MRDAPMRDLPVSDALVRAAGRTCRDQPVRPASLPPADVAAVRFGT